MMNLSRLIKRAEEQANFEDSDEGRREWLKNEIINAIKQVYDPEIPINIYDLGLIYDIELDEQNNVEIKMTLTSPACPVAGTLPGMVEAAARSPMEVSDVNVELVWYPPWDRSRMSEEALLALNLL